jgi:hypothetical protein
VIKSLSSGDLKWLMDDATRRGWSANGRPEWFRQHEDQVRAVTLVLFGSEAAGALRCIVTVVLSDRSGGRFTLDVSSSALDALPDIDRRAVIILAHEYLATFPHIALDPDQAASWEGSAWQRWGEA